MPIYTYRCPACDEVIEVIHSMNSLDMRRIHAGCGVFMERVISIFSFSSPVSNRDRVLKALNKELPLPASPKDRPRIEKALAKGLNWQKPIIGKGF